MHASTACHAIMFTKLASSCRYSQRLSHSGSSPAYLVVRCRATLRHRQVPYSYIAERLIRRGVLPGKLSVIARSAAMMDKTPVNEAASLKPASPQK